jgi:hypothetical protein
MFGLHSSSRRLDMARALRVGAITALTIGGLATTVPSAVAATTPMVSLGQASTYAVLSGASVANTASAVGAPHTTLHGDLGVKADTQPTGFPPGVVTGTTRVGTAAVAQAHADLVTAYNEVKNRSGGIALAGALAGMTITPGLHTIAAAASNTTTLTLDAQGDPNAVFVFQVNGALAFAAASHVVLANGAQASRVFWQVNGAGAIGAGASFAGALMALDAVGVGNGTVVNGRAFALNGALALDLNEFYSAPPEVTIDGGATAFTNDATPTISGTTDIVAPAVVTVTFAGQTLTATPTAGSWAVTSAIRVNGAYPVVASVTDGAGNSTSAAQQLTIDTVLPIVTLDDGPSVTTNDPTPTIAGTTDVATGTIVHVTVGSQSLNALVHTGGTWNIRAPALTDGVRTVTATVSDLAGNAGTDSQVLTVDTTAPAVAIAGGPTALTNDATPQISGTAGVGAGTTVTVTLADETLTAPVQAGGGWSVIAAALADGPHRVVMSVSDAAGNAAAYTQTLTVDTVSPVVAIGGGATATTTDLSPTVVGTSDAAPGTTVTVTIAGQAMTTLVQANGTWNATPTIVGRGAWPVVASVSDPAGNVGSATQTLTIAGAPSSDATDLAPMSPAAIIPLTQSPTPAEVPGSTATPTPRAAGPLNVAASTIVTRALTQRVKGLSLSIATKVTAPAKGRVVATATGVVRIQGVAKAIKLSSLTATIGAGKTATLTLKPKGTKIVARMAFERIKKAVMAAKKVTATITIRIVDSAGHARVVKRTLKLTK